MEQLALDVIKIDAFPTLTLSFIVFFLGAFLTRKVAFLKNYNIPEPVLGGLVAALIVWGFVTILGKQIVFDLSVRDQLLVIFFATIGLNARFSDLLAGGKLLGILLVLTIVFMMLQNAVGLIGAQLFDLPNALGVLLGSASLIGGHGTAIAWGPTIEAQTGFAAADEIGIATATLGLVIAALMGGPIAKFLIDRKNLKSTDAGNAIVGLSYDAEDEQADTVTHVSLMRSLLAAHVAVILGYLLNIWLNNLGLKLPLFVACLMAGIVMSNTIPYLFPKLPWPAKSRALAVVADYSLSVFLVMSLMSMQLWTLSGLGASLAVVLFMQAVVTTVFIMLVLFRFMGADYTAAVLSAGFAGFALGATPTAIANMSSVTKRYGPAPLALIVLPLVSAFFVDLSNAFIIKFFVSL